MKIKYSPQAKEELRRMDLTHQQRENEILADLRATVLDASLNAYLKERMEEGRYVIRRKDAKR